MGSDDQASGEKGCSQVLIKKIFIHVRVQEFVCDVVVYFRLFSVY